MDAAMVSLFWLLLLPSSFAFPIARLVPPQQYPTTTLTFRTTALLSTRQNITVETETSKDALTDDVKPFDEYLQMLQNFVNKHGHARAYPERHPGPLADWVLAIQNYEYPLYRNQRKEKIYNETTTTTSTLYLNDERVAELSRLGFEFRRLWTWEERMEDLLAFQKEHGHVRVPRRYGDNPSLGNWVSRVRQQYRDYQNDKNTTLSIQQIQQLESLGFEWEIKLGLRKDAWQQRIDELLEFQKEHGHCRVPPTYKQNPDLAQWVLNLRQNYRLREEMRLVVLSQERMDELEGYGFEWDTRILKWADRLEELREYAKREGHVRVPKHYSENPQLGRWTSTQRTQYRYYKEGKLSKLSDEQVQQLEEVGFQWCNEKGHGPRIETWEQRWKELKEYQEKHDLIGVPLSDNSPLSRWFRYQHSQYQLYKEGETCSLSDDQIRRLEELGIDKFKNVRDQKWDGLLEQLKEFRDEHGHCRVPQQYAPNPTLGNWVNTVRQQYFKAQEEGQPNPRLTDEKINQLSEIGFDFSRRRRAR